MPDHHYSTPRVVYVGLAYGRGETRKASQAARAAATSASVRPNRDRVVHRRPAAAGDPGQPDFS